MTSSASFELKGRTSEGWKRLFFVDRTVPWTWIRVESSEYILQLRFVGELTGTHSFVTIDDVETFSIQHDVLSWENTCFILLGGCVCALVFLECSRNSACCQSSRKKPHGTALNMMDEEHVPLGLELVTVSASEFHEGKIVEEVDCIAF